MYGFEIPPLTCTVALRLCGSAPSANYIKKEEEEEEEGAFTLSPLAVARFLERKKATFTSPSGRATPPRQPPLPLCGRSCRNQLLPPRVSPPVAAPKNRVVRKRALVRASAWLRALAGPQALQNHTALPGASAAHQGRCAARPLGRSRSQPPAESPARAREAWCSQQRGVNLQGAPGGTSASVPVHRAPTERVSSRNSLITIT